MKGLKFFAVLFLLLSLFTFPVFAGNELSDFFDSLDNESKNAFPDGFDDEIREGDGTDAVKSLDGQFIIKAIIKLLKTALSDTAPFLTSLIAVIFFSALANTFFDRDTDKPQSIISSMCCVLCCLNIIKPLLESTKNALESMSLIIKASLPVMAVLGAGSGQASSTAVNSLWLNTQLALLEQLSQSVIMPICTVCLTFITVNAVLKETGGTDLSGIVNAIKKIFTFFITLLSSALCIAMSFQSVVAKGSDGVLIRSIKFASASAIPIVGGALSEAAGTYLSSFSLIKSSFGAICAFAVVMSVLPLLLKLFAVKAALTFSYTASGLLGSSLSLLIKEFSSVIDLLISVICLCAVSFTVAIASFSSVVTV